MSKWFWGVLLIGLSLVLVVPCRFWGRHSQQRIEKGPSLLGYRNVRDYVRKNVRFQCKPIAGGSNFNSLLVGCPSRPYMGEPALLVRLPDGTIINTATVDVEILMAKARSVTELTGTFFYDIGFPSIDMIGDSYVKWPDGAQELQIHGWIFRVQSNRLISFQVAFHDYSKEETYDTIYQEDGTKVVKKRVNYGAVPAIGRPGENTLHPFPLKQSEVVHVFGTPDKIRDYLVD